MPDSIYMPDWLAMIRIALSMVAMIFLGPYFVLLLYALWLPCAYYKKRLTLYLSKDITFPVAVAAYFLLSTLWSAHAGGTARAALEFASVMCCSIIIARLVRTPALVKGITAGMCMALIAIVISAGGIKTETALVGSLGSKNQVAVNAEIGFYCALMSWFLFKSWWKKMVFSFLPLLFCTVCLYLSKSATADLSLLATLLISYATYFLGRLPRSFRMTCFIAMVVGAVLIGVIGMAMDWESFGLKAVGKDTTLTGRTYLWSEGYKTGMRNPVLGVGYGAFWIPGTPEAEKIWYKFGIADKSGFHFHNLFVNLFVELGAVGVLLWGVVYLATCFKGIRHVLKNGVTAESVFYVGVACMYLVRAMTEVDTTGPYGVGPLLFFIVVARIAAQARRKPAQDTERPVTPVPSPAFLQSSLTKDEL